MKKFLSRQAIAWLLSVVMIISVLPVPVFAEGGQTTNAPVIESELPIEEAGPAADLFSLKANQKLVSSEAELEYAIATATGTKEEPTEIIVDSDIVLPGPITVPANKHIILKGNVAGSYDSNRCIRLADDVAQNATNSLITLNTPGSMEINNITLDANKKARVVGIADGSYDLTINEGTWLKNGYGNAAGIRSWPTQGNVNITLNGGKITDCTATKNSAAVQICCDKNGTANGVLTINNIEITGCSCGYADVLLYNTADTAEVTGYLNGGSAERISILTASQEKPLTLYYNGFHADTIALQRGAQAYLLAPIENPTTIPNGYRSNGDIIFEGYNGYTVTDSDAMNLGNSFYADKESNQIKCWDMKTVTFHANDGTDTTATQAVPSGVATALTKNTFTNGEKVFAGWNTLADGSGQAYADGAEVTFNADTDLYAQWKEDTSASGNCGPKDGNGEFTDSAKWAFDAETGILTISGKGAMADFASNSDRPWNALAGNITGLKIGEGITYLGTCSFNELANMRGDIVLPDSVTSVGHNVFRKSGIDSLDLNNVTELTEGALIYSCPNITSIKMNNLITVSGANNFRACPKLKHIEAKKLKFITETTGATFYGNQSLEVVKLPALEHLGDSAFCQSDNLKAVVLPNLKTISGGNHFHLYKKGCIVYIPDAEIAKAFLGDNLVIYNSAAAVLNGGKLEDDVIFESGKLATPVNDDKNLMFEGWYETEDFKGDPVTEAVTEGSAKKVYYAKWFDATNIKEATNETELQALINAAVGTAENPAEIIVKNDIVLTKTLVVKDKHIKLIGADDTVTISIGENFAYNDSVIYITSDSDNEISFTFENITLDGRTAKQKAWRMLGTKPGVNSVINMVQKEGEKTILYGCNAPAGALGAYSGTYGSAIFFSGTFNMNGGEVYASPYGIYVLTNATFNMNDGKIDATGCEKTYSGILYGYYQNNTTLNIHGGEIITSLGGSYGGSAVTAITNVNIDGGYIHSSVENNGNNYIAGTNVNIGGIFTIKDGGEMNAFGSAATVVSPLTAENERSEIIVSASKIGDGNAIAKSSETYEITETDLTAFNIDSQYVLYLAKDETTNKNAIYAAPKVEVTFNANDGAADAAVTVQEVPKNVATALDENIFTNGDKVFAGWAETANGDIVYKNCQKVTLTGNMTLYAVWTAESGNCGPKNDDGDITDTATWEFDTESGTLTIGGTGEMADFDDPGEQPWSSFGGEVKNLAIADGVTKIGQSAFRGLPISGSVTIPASVTEIDPLAFLGCEKITEFVVDAQNPDFCAEDGILYKKLPADQLELVAYPCAKADESFTVPANVTKLGPHSLRYTKLKYIDIPDSVTEFGEACLNDSALAEQSFILVAQAETAAQVETCFDRAKTSILVLNGGSLPAYTVLESGRLAPPVKDGHIFNGWFTDAAFTTAAPETAAAGAAYYANWNAAGELTVTAAGYTGEYDGNFHTITITPSDAGATILYSADNGKTYTDKIPQYKNSGEYVVYYKVQKAGCLDVTGAVLVTIDKIPNPVTITPSSEKVTGGKTVTFTITAPDDVTINSVTATLDGVACEEITVTKNDDGTFSAVMPTQTGTYTFLVDASGDKINNSENDAACTVTVKKKTSSGGSSGSSVVSSVTEPVVGTVVSPVDKTMTAEAAKTDANETAAKADKADDTLALVSQNGTTVSGKDFSQPAVLSIPVNTNDVDVKDVNDLTLAKLNTETGKLEIVGGSYDAEAKAVVGYITEAGDYFVVSKDDLLTIVLQIGNYLAKVNGADKVLDAAPLISQDRTMVPLRFVFETFDAKVEWLGATKTVVITADGKVLTMTIDKELEDFDAAPVISNGRIMVPIRYVSTELGAKVVWVHSTKTVYIAK